MLLMPPYQSPVRLGASDADVLTAKSV
jgi:hypothetical protein